MTSKHNMAAAVALGLLSVFPIFAIQYDDAGARNEALPVYEVIASWPDAPREAALTLVETYGVPDEVTAEALTWHRDDPWQHTVVYRLDAAMPRTVQVAAPEQALLGN